MMLLDSVPKGITLERAPYEWRLIVQHPAANGLSNLIFHAIGLGFVLFLELVLIVDFFEDWRFHSNSWLKVLFYALQDGLFLWIVLEMLRSIRRLIAQQEKALHLRLCRQGFALAYCKNKQQPTQETWYATTTLQELYSNRGLRKRGMDTQAILLNVPQELFIGTDQGSPDAWGYFLEEAQTTYLAELLQTLYLEQEVVGLIGADPQKRAG